MTLHARFLLGSALALSFAAGCSGTTGGSGTDAGHADMDASSGEPDAGYDGGACDRDSCVHPDASAADTGSGDGDGGTVEIDAASVDAGSVDAWCSAPPPCAAPPPGCSYVGAGSCDCGTLVCAGSCSPACTVGDYCDHCGAMLECKPMPADMGLICPDIYDPQCGCDGVTYSNACALGSAGMPLWHAGECTDTPVDPPTPGDCTMDSDCAPSEWCQSCRTSMGARNVCLPRGAVC